MFIFFIGSLLVLVIGLSKLIDAIAERSHQIAQLIFILGIILPFGNIIYFLYVDINFLTFDNRYKFTVSIIVATILTTFGKCNLQKEQ